MIRIDGKRESVQESIKSMTLLWAMGKGICLKKCLMIWYSYVKK